MKLLKFYKKGFIEKQGCNILARNLSIVYQNQLNNQIMNDLIQKYETEKSNAIQFMKKGEISAYLNSLIAMNKYKKLLFPVVTN